MKYARKNTTDYLVRFRNAQKVNESCNGSLVTKGIQYHGVKILLPFFLLDLILYKKKRRRRQKMQERK